MAKCFITGIEITLDQTHLLDIRAANNAVHHLRQRLHALESLLDQLGTRDARELYDPQDKRTFVRHERRLVCQAAADLLAAPYPEKRLFISWPEYRARRMESGTQGQPKESNDESDNYYYG